MSGYFQHVRNADQQLRTVERSDKIVDLPPLSQPIIQESGKSTKRKLTSTSTYMSTSTQISERHSDTDSDTSSRMLDGTKSSRNWQQKKKKKKRKNRRR